MRCPTVPMRYLSRPNSTMDDSSEPRTYPCPMPDGTHLAVTVLFENGRAAALAEPWPTWAEILTHCPGATTEEQVASYAAHLKMLERRTKRGDRRARGALMLIWLLQGMRLRAQRTAEEAAQRPRSWYEAEATPTTFGLRTGD